MKHQRGLVLLCQEPTWLSPMTEVTIADPNPVVTLTLMPPIILQTMIYHSMVFLPYLRRSETIKITCAQ